MLIGSRTVVGAAGAFALVGAGLWLSSVVWNKPQQQPHAAVEIQQVHERSWAVEVKDLGYQAPPADTTKTASVSR
jgi:hypothetical protein